MNTKMSAVRPILVLIVISCIAGVAEKVFCGPTWDEQLGANAGPSLGLNADLHGRRVFGPESDWNMPVDKLPVDPDSDAIIARIGADKPLHAGFGASYRGRPFGFTYYCVSNEQQTMPVVFSDDQDSDSGDYPIPPYPQMEVDDADRQRGRLIIVDITDWKLYEMADAYVESNGAHGSSGAIYDLNVDTPRTLGFRSADDAGLPIFPGLVRYDETAYLGEITHALRFTVSQTRRACVPPARHFDGKKRDPDLPPMGMRVRLKASFDISSFSPEDKIILTALKKYGMILADQGPDWELSGVADKRWNDAELNALTHITGSDFEVVKMGTPYTN